MKKSRGSPLTLKEALAKTYTIKARADTTSGYLHFAKVLRGRKVKLRLVR